MPATKCRLETAGITRTGNLLFSGIFGIGAVFGGELFKMEKLGYGLKNGEFKFNGIAAKGEIGSHLGGDSKKRKILGHGAGKISADINTFEGQEKYNFDMELNVKDLFEAEASLYLSRLYNGSLCPNKLWVYVNSQKGGINIPTPAPVVTLTGGGIGIDGLADMMLLLP